MLPAGHKDTGLASVPCHIGGAVVLEPSGDRVLMVPGTPTEAAGHEAVCVACMSGPCCQALNWQLPKAVWHACVHVKATTTECAPDGMLLWCPLLYCTVLIDN